MFVDKIVKIFSFTSGSFSGFKQVARIMPTVCRCRPIAEPGKRVLYFSAQQNTMVKGTVNLWYWIFLYPKK
jgi:hypothetical protein